MPEEKERSACLGGMKADNYTDLAGKLSGLIRQILACAGALAHENFPGRAQEEGRTSLEKCAVRLRKLQLKSPDSELSLGIAGEFSCGKSSFVNAFLACRLLPESPPGEKSSVPLVIRSGFPPMLKARARDGSLIDYPLPDQASPGRLAIPDFKSLAEGNIECLLCQAACPALPCDFVLVELPSLAGENPLPPAVRDMAAFCDVLLVLGHINRPLSLGLLREVKSLRGENAENCIFIATACDLLGEADLKRMRAYFSTRLRERFAAAPPFYFVSALAALEDGLEGSNRIYDQVCFAKFRNDLLARLETIRPRLLLQSSLREAEQITADMREILASLSLSSREALREHIARREERRNAAITRIMDDYRKMASQAYERLEPELHELLVNMRAVLAREIARCDDLTSLRSFALLHNPLLLEKIFRQCTRFFTTRLNEELSRSVNRINFKYDLEWICPENAISEGKIAHILEDGREGADYISHLANMAGEGRGKGWALQPERWLSCVARGIEAFASTLLDRSGAEELEKAKNLFLDSLESSFARLDKRACHDFQAFYIEILAMREKELAQLLRTTNSAVFDSNETGRDMVKFVRSALRRLAEYEKNMSEIYKKLGLMRTLLVKGRQD